MSDPPNYGQGLKFRHAVVLLSRIQCPASVGNRVSSAISLFLVQDGSQTHDGCIRFQSKVFAKARLCQDWGCYQLRFQGDESCFTIRRPLVWYVFCSEVMQWLCDLCKSRHKAVIVRCHTEESSHTLYILRSREVLNSFSYARVRTEAFSRNHMSKVFHFSSSEHTLDWLQFQVDRLQSVDDFTEVNDMVL